ncbi:MULTISPECIES: 1,4-alpha-glucan branching protein GlgB [unclassified Herbaspirillum]|uniref:1,4-alpha-glucan branching protein GlgB n=1 Tax=unclassified Herbaspirillum TaxID=2624150 RepID=UPI001F2F2787|nr:MULTISPECIES: 1,4-alpha-glucan branching protein GlgB [unclassified Herbaspirillum]
MALSLRNDTHQNDREIDHAVPDLQLASSLQQATLGDPFALLGPRYADLPDGGQRLRLCCYYPGATAVQVFSRPADERDPHGVLLGNLIQLGAVEGSANGIFYGDVNLPAQAHREIPYVLHVAWPGKNGKLEEVQITEDPYAFDLLISDFDLHLFREGRHRQLARCLGSQVTRIDGVDGVRFAVWAPNARRVSVIGDFNQWDGRRHPMRLRQSAGVWELFVPRLRDGTLYKYEITGPDGRVQPSKADPMARATELPPATASRVIDDRDGWRWRDDEWMAQRAQKQSLQAPISIYEVHAASWMRILEEEGRSLSWNELAERLIPYAKGMGFTHLELLPVMEHPFGGSWGYQPLSQFAPSARFGSAADFAGFVDSCHREGLGVILDWVPAHFPSDGHGLAHFDGTPLYEHGDPREGFHQDWNTLIYNLGRNEVRGFMIASALEWLEHFHVDGLRVDAVASMLYRDYSREPGQWVPNIHGGRENLESVDFLRELNQTVIERCPGALMIAEESTSWPGVTAPVKEGGLGFTYKWNMGWMHDTLRYVEEDSIYRRYHHHDFTFGMIYAYSEAFVLPISHDEVVHGKRTLLEKMPGDYWQKLANLRAYLGFMWTHPGKKLLFMGCEFGQYQEFDHDKSPQWDLLDDPRHRSIQRLVRDLNGLYTGLPALHLNDTRAEGFSWVVGNDSVNSVFAYFRHGNEGEGDEPLLVAVNMTPVPRHNYRIGVPTGAANEFEWKEILNTDADIYGGSNLGNAGSVTAQQQEWRGHPASLLLTLPPLSTIILRRGK